MSRGYRRHTRGYIQANAKSTAKTIGDEPYQMHAKFPSVTVAVDENRCHGIDQLLKLKAPSIDVILLDDAFQHRYVKPGLSILLTDYRRLFCDDTMLPAGRLREPIIGKNRAQIVIVTKCPPSIKPIEFNIIAKRLKLYPYQELFFTSFRYGNIRAVFPNSVTDANQEMSLSSLRHTDVLLVTGIASPAQMVEELNVHAAKIDLISFGDHHDFSSKDLHLIADRFNSLKEGNRLIITTEKDATRLINEAALDEELKPFIYALPIEIEILQNQQNSFNQYIIDYVRENKIHSSVS